MRTADFDYALPDELIAQAPAEPRDSARLMVVRREAASIEHRTFADLPDLLGRGDLLIVNDTRVMAARIRGRRVPSGGTVEALLTRRRGPRTWEALFRPARHAGAGSRFVFTIEGTETPAVSLGRDGTTATLEFGREFDPRTAGEVPLPPYIKGFRGDPERYQTVYGREARSAAAPTAGLHFTAGLFARLGAAGIATTAITLDVGPGTFLPVVTEDPRDHRMHAEHTVVSPEAAERINATRAAGGRAVAVGTTVVRTLEQAAADDGSVGSFDGWTELKILPGHTFRAVDALVTNFHLPRSTLLMLVSAFAGRELVLAAYREAVAHRYRFYSFGDAMLLLP
jgi:S-adenosylmethionine:tRNA ribosyltransferase-isomerase